MRDLLEVDDLAPHELREVLDLARRPDLPRLLEGRGVALLFEKPSLRTRSSMEMAVAQLGGHPVAILPDEVGLGTRETVEDVARTLACYHSVIAARVFDDHHLHRMAAAVDVPVVNLLSDDGHPLQALADVLTLVQMWGDELRGRAVAYVGDGNNVCRSLGIAAGMLGMDVRIATPQGFELKPHDLDRIRASGVDPLVTARPSDAVAGADVIYTDVWASMGQEGEAAARREAFAGFTVDDEMLSAAAPEAVVLHCLPAHRGEEISASVLEGARSRVWQQAANRMHAARGALAWLLGHEGGGGAR